MRLPAARPAVPAGLAGRRTGLPAFDRWGMAGPAALLGLFLGLPVVVLVVRAALGGALGRAIAAPAVLGALGLSLATTAASLVLTVALGFPFAHLLARRPPRGAALLETLVDLPVVLPPSVAGLALLLVFGREGLLGGSLDALGVAIPFTTGAVILAQTFVSAPLFVRSARAGLAAVDPAAEDAARVDGAGEAAVLRWVTVPLAAPYLASGIVMAWARSLGEFGATIMFAGNIAGRTQTLPLVVYAEFQGGALDAAIAASAMLAVAAFAVLVAVRLLGGRATDLRSVA